MKARLNAPGSAIRPLDNAVSAYEALDLMVRAQEAIFRTGFSITDRDYLLHALDDLQLKIAACLAEGREVVELKL